ncbi:hypothetical protein [Prescottella equi]|uniref:hypothetical protein n=1 Tax=Rhodococcus hoagii TaxID=43767 RepID=UPI00111C5B72|nr:hypothetical protein [Prescottella equi]
MTETRWWRYVQRVIGDDAYKDAASRSGFDQSAFTRWRKGAQPDVAFVVKFARGYHQSVLEALVEAEIITESEAQLQRVQVGKSEVLRAISTEELADELSRRIRDAHDWWAAYEKHHAALERPAGRGREDATKGTEGKPAKPIKRIPRRPKKALSTDTAHLSMVADHQEEPVEADQDDSRYEP